MLLVRQACFGPMVLPAPLSTLVLRAHEAECGQQKQENARKYVVRNQEPVFAWWAMQCKRYVKVGHFAKHGQSISPTIVTMANICGYDASCGS